MALKRAGGTCCSRYLVHWYQATVCSNRHRFSSFGCATITSDYSCWLNIGYTYSLLCKHVKCQLYAFIANVLSTYIAAHMHAQHKSKPGILLVQKVHSLNKCNNLPFCFYRNFLVDLSGVLESVAASQKNGTWEKVDGQGCTIDVLQSDTTWPVVTELWCCKRLNSWNLIQFFNLPHSQ